MADAVRAAGAVVWRDDGSAADRTPRRSGTRMLAVIHRPRYDDWSLPKGKLDEGEDDQTAAIREIREETGQGAEIVRDLGEIEYEVTKGGSTYRKVVRYFEMRVTDPRAFTPDDEVDDIRWLPVHEALLLLTYERDRTVIRRYDPSAPDVPL